MPPNGFTAICDVNTPDVPVSLIGVVVGIKQRKPTRGTDWVQDFTIQDDFSTGAVGSEFSINCRMFIPGPDQFPNINVNDVALLRKFKTNQYGLHLDVCFNHTLRSSALIFPSTGIPVTELSQPYQSGALKLPYSATKGANDATVAEQMAVIQLKHAAAGFKQQVTQHAAAIPFQAPKRDKLSLIKDLDFNLFYDIRAEVVNIYRTGRATVDIKITDYTANKDLFLFVDPDDEDYGRLGQNWKGPYGQIVMNVLLYGSNAAWAQENVSEGSFVFLKNVRTKMSPLNKLEGAMHEDMQRPNKVDIRMLTKVSDIREIQERKKEYENARTKKSALDVLQNEPKKSSAKASANKKKDKRAKQRAQKEQELEEIARQAEKWEVARSGVNPHIQAAFPDMQLSTLSEIIHNPKLESRTERHNNFTFPFLNCRHRSRVRVVDFFPPELEMFVHCLSDPSWDKRAKRQDSELSASKVRWEWGFVLLLEDAKVPQGTVSEKLRVVVSNDSAQYLLDMDARDLKRDPRKLKKLEEKLFILWGNLLELKTELRDKGSDMPLPPGDNRLQNKPFDCCLEEYGHEVRLSEKHPEGYQRMHRLAQTRIMAI